MKVYVVKNTLCGPVAVFTAQEDADELVGSVADDEDALDNEVVEFELDVPADRSELVT